MAKKIIQSAKNKAKANIKPTKAAAKPKPETELEPIQDENIDEQAAEFVEIVHSICKLPHHNDDGTINWDMVYDCVDILAQKKPGIENLESHDQHAIAQHIYHHFKEADLPIPDQIAALA